MVTRLTTACCHVHIKDLDKCNILGHGALVLDLSQFKIMTEQSHRMLLTEEVVKSGTKNK